MLVIQFLLNLLLLKQSYDLIEQEFDKFIEKYDKPYKNNHSEYRKRIENFQKSLKEAEDLNSLRTHNNSAYYGITKYSDLTKEEFLQMIQKNGIVKTKREKRELRRFKVLRDELRDVDIPAKFDWRDKNVVTEVRNQGKCGACWAHSTVATIESMVAIRAKKLTEFSVQQLVDCSKEENEGCRGGDTCSALEWMNHNNVTLHTKNDYPTQDFAGQCKNNLAAPGVRIQSNFTCENFLNNEARMVKLIAKHGPLIAAVDASSWQNYLGGTIQFHCFNDLNHAVQITGYDLENVIPYYKVRNTWDVSFGIDGYAHIAIGENLCGISEEVSALDVSDIPEAFY